MLTPQQKTSFVQDGYVHLPGAIAPEMIDRAVQSINCRIGQGINPADLPTFQSQGFFPELKVDPVTTDLFNASSVRDTVGELLGPENFIPPVSGQLALRFPEPVGTPPRAPGPHIDGIHTPHNGVPKGTLSSFTCLVGVFLTDVTRDFAGNFSIWPGSHLKIEAHFRENGIDSLLNEGKMPRLDQGEALQVHARAGDVVLAHYQLLHGITINIAPLPRYAVFFRIKHKMHNEQRMECLTNLWLEWPGLREFATS